MSKSKVVTSARADNNAASVVEAAPSSKASAERETAEQLLAFVLVGTGDTSDLIADAVDAATRELRAITHSAESLCERPDDLFYALHAVERKLAVITKLARSRGASR